MCPVVYASGNVLLVFLISNLCTTTSLALLIPDWTSDEFYLLFNLYAFRRFCFWYLQSDLFIYWWLILFFLYYSLRLLMRGYAHITYPGITILNLYGLIFCSTIPFWWFCFWYFHLDFLDFSQPFIVRVPISVLQSIVQLFSVPILGWLLTLSKVHAPSSKFYFSFPISSTISVLIDHFDLFHD
jgi:hypothetical protein